MLGLTNKFVHVPYNWALIIILVWLLKQQSKQCHIRSTMIEPFVYISKLLVFFLSSEMIRKTLYLYLQSKIITEIIDCKYVLIRCMNWRYFFSYRIISISLRPENTNNYLSNVSSVSTVNNEQLFGTFSFFWKKGTLRKSYICLYTFLTLYSEFNILNSFSFISLLMSRSLLSKGIN